MHVFSQPHGSSVGKPVTLFMRERNPAGTTIKQVHGVTANLTNGFQALNASITVARKGDVIDVFVAQDRASAGDMFQADSISLAPVS